MLRLQSTEPFWLGKIPGTAEDPRPFMVEGVRVQMRPIGPKAFRAARVACFAALASEDPSDEEACDALSRELIRRGIVAWEGIGDAEGEVINEPTLPTIEMFVQEPATFLPAQELYVYPYLARDTEGNGSAAAPSGTGAAAMQGKATAKKPARARTARAAGTARTRKTSATPKKAKPSGK